VRTTVRLLVISAATVVAGAGCQGGWETCSFIEETFRGRLVESEGLAFRASSGQLGSKESGGGGYQGRLVNHDSEQDCVAAMYHFDAEPRAEDIPILMPGAPAPPTTPDGGVLVTERILPRTVELVREIRLEGHEYWLSLADDPFGDSHLERWVVIALCDQPDVQASVRVSLVLCREGDDPPSLTSEAGVERLW
jgi:hypothetical protein